MNKTLSALTALDSPYPPFINISETEGGDVQFSLRAPATDTEGVYVCGHASDRGKHGRCTPGDGNCNNYCNMAPEKGPMADSPKPCRHIDVGASVVAVFPRHDAIRTLEEALAALKGGAA